MILCLSDLWVPFPGGAERLMFGLARDLRRRGQRVGVVTGYEAARRFDGPPVAVEDFTTDRDEGGHLLLDLIDLLRPRAILTHHHYAYRFEPELVASGIPLVQIVLNGRRIPSAALAVYISSWTERTCGDARPGDMVIHPPAFDDVIAGTHGDAIGFVKPIPHKGVDLLYRIAEALPRRRFVVLRGEWQGLEDIRRRPNVTFMEPVVDIRDFYARVNLLLVPSRSEDAGTVAQEATRNGLPCISSDVGGLAETNGGGIRLAPDDLPAWLRAITALDDERTRAELVARQAAHLDALDVPGALDRFAAAVEAITKADRPRIPA